jgi:hypothetical protein
MGARALQQRHYEAQTDAILWGDSDFVVGIGASPLMWSFGGGDSNAFYEAFRTALAPLRLEPTFVQSVKGVSTIRAAAVFALLDAVAALPEGASEEQQRVALDAVAVALEDVVCLDEWRFVGGDAENGPLPVAEQLRLARAFKARVEQARDATMRKRKATIAERTPEQQAPRRRPNQSRATNQSHVARVPPQEASTNKRVKTVETYNANLAPGMSASGSPWASDEMKKLLKAVEAHGKSGKSAWQRVADAVGSRTSKQCRDQYARMKKNGRLDPISEDTPLREGVFSGFGKPAFKKFAECVALVDGKRITTVGQLAALDLVKDIEYLMTLTGYPVKMAIKQAAPWKEKAAEAIEFWQ